MIQWVEVLCLSDKETKKPKPKSLVVGYSFALTAAASPGGEGKSMPHWLWILMKKPCVSFIHSIRFCSESSMLS